MQYRFVLATLVAATVYAAPAGERRYEPFEPLQGGSLSGSPLLPEETMMLAVTNAEQKRDPLISLPEEVMMVAVTTPEEPIASPLNNLAIAKKRQVVVPPIPPNSVIPTGVSPLNPNGTPVGILKRKPIIPEEVMMLAVSNPLMTPMAAIAKKRQPAPAAFTPLSGEIIAKKREPLLPEEFMMVAVSNPEVTPSSEIIAKKRHPLIPEEVMMLAVSNPEATPSSGIIAKKRQFDNDPLDVMMSIVNIPEQSMSTPRANA